MVLRTAAVEIPLFLHCVYLGTFLSVIRIASLLPVNREDDLRASDDDAA